ncbi:NAD(P)H-hydrate epimerase [Candidatus Omnitrophota bacterium]
MKGVSAEQMAEIDRKAQEDYGIAQIDLMENAGHSTARVIIEDTPSMKDEKIGILCGKGNNGGDGFVVARHLMKECPERLTVYITDPKGVKPGAALDNLKVIQDLKIDICPMNDLDLAGITMAVDAIFGTGFRGELSEDLKEIARKLNGSAAKVYAVDVPSGLNSTTGEASKDCFRSDKTITFGLPKQGFFVKDGPAVCGEIVLKDIGFPEALLKEYM